MGNVAGFTPALAMDVWEHAFLLDYWPVIYTPDHPLDSKRKERVWRRVSALSRFVQRRVRLRRGEVVRRSQ
jgi:hypothetical protein